MEVVLVSGLRVLGDSLTVDCSTTIKGTRGFTIQMTGEWVLSQGTGGISRTISRRGREAL